MQTFLDQTDDFFDVRINDKILSPEGREIERHLDALVESLTVADEPFFWGYQRSLGQFDKTGKWIAADSPPVSYMSFSPTSKTIKYRRPSIAEFIRHFVQQRPFRHYVEYEDSEKQEQVKRLYLRSGAIGISPNLQGQIKWMVIDCDVANSLVLLLNKVEPEFWRRGIEVMFEFSRPGCGHLWIKTELMPLEFGRALIFDVFACAGVDPNIFEIFPANKKQKHNLIRLFGGLHLKDLQRHPVRIGETIYADAIDMICKAWLPLKPVTIAQVKQWIDLDKITIEPDLPKSDEQRIPIGAIVKEDAATKARILNEWNSMPDSAEGGRTTSIYAAAVKARDWGLPEHLAIELVDEHFNKVKNEPPHDYEKVATTVRDAYKYAKNEMGCKTVEYKIQQIWQESLPITEGDPAWQYLLENRGRRLPDNHDLRFHADLPLGETQGLPALIAPVRNLSGELLNVQKTYLLPDELFGGFRKIKRQTFYIEKGGCGVIQIMPLHDGCEELGIATSVESALACWERLGMPVWAVADDYSLSWFAFPEGIKKLKILADNRRKNQLSASKLGSRAIRAGLEVRTLTPDEPGSDWDTVLIGRSER